MAGPWDKYASQTSAAPLVIGNPRPKSPTFIPGTDQVYDTATGQAKDIPGLKRTPGADQRDRKQVVNNSVVDLDTGEVTPLKMPDAATVDPEQARSHVSDILGKIDEAEGLLGKPLTSGLPGSIFGHVPGTNAYVLRSLVGDPTDPGNPGQITGDLRQQGIAYLRALNGGSGVGTVARSQQEQAALQSAMSNIRQGLPADELKGALNDVKQIYLRAYARSYGLDPDKPDVQQRFGINPLWQPPGGTPPQEAPTGKPKQIGETTPKDNGITASAPPPAIGPGLEVHSSASGQAKIDPSLAKIGPQLSAYINDPKVTDAMVLGYMEKNGVDPASTNIKDVLQTRAAAMKNNQRFGSTVDPRYNVPLTGERKIAAEVATASPGGVPVGPFLVGAADTGTLGTGPDVVGSLPGFSRTELIQARDAAANESPTATLLGNLAGGFLPLPGAAEANAIGRLGRTAGAGATYGFFGSEDPNVLSRGFNAGLGGLVGALGHGVADAGLRGVQGAYRTAARPVESLLIGPEATADKFALNAAARKMPTQNLAEAGANDAAAKAAGVPQPAAASINRGGQDYLARQANSYPQARAIVDTVADKTRAAIPEQLAGDFNSAIEAAAPKGVDTSAYLNRPVREIASDIQSMAGREFERGIEPIKGEKMALTPDLTGDLEHERVAGAIRDALANHNLSAETRNELRSLIPQLKTLAGAPDLAREAYAKGIPLSVDSARNIATALDRTAGKLADGSEGQVELSRLSRDIRGAIAEQFPEYAPVNARYASRMRAKEAMFEARKNFLASTPEAKDALAKASRNFTDEANPPEFGAEPETSPNGFRKPAQPLPSNRQIAIAGAREAASVNAGENGAGTAQRIASNVNQRGNNATVMGAGAKGVENRAAVRANVANAVDRIASSSPNDKTETMFSLVRQAVITKATGGGGRYMLAHAAAAMPGLSADDASRVVRLYLNADSGKQVLDSLTRAYGARRARFIMARMAAVTSAATGVRGFPNKSAP